MLNTFKATAKSLGGVKVETSARDFKLIIDEPEQSGGNNEGMTPVEALLCAYGSCLTITIQAFARAKRINIDDVRVELEGDLDPDGFMGKSDCRKGFQDIRYTVHLKTDAADEEVEKFLDFVSQTCPIADNLTNGVPCRRVGFVKE